MIDISISDNSAVVGSAVENRRTSHRGLLDDSEQDSSHIRYLGLIIELQVILLEVLRSGQPIFCWLNSSSICLDPLVAVCPAVPNNFFGLKSINKEGNADEVRTLSKVAHIVFLIIVDGSSLKIVEGEHPHKKDYGNPQPNSHFLIINIMGRKIYLLLILILGLQALTFFQSEFDVQAAQEDFDLKFCGGCHTLHKDICAKNKAYLEGLPSPWTFDTNSISNNSYHIKNISISISTSTGNYSFPAVQFINQTMKSVLFLPESTALQGIILYFHPTVIGKDNGPSALGAQIIALGGLYSSQNYAVIFPNYLGFDIDVFPHPYVLYPQQNLRSGIIALNQLVADGVLNSYVNGVLDVYVVGYSQGSLYSIWAAKCIQFPGACPYFSDPKNPYFQVKLDTKCKLSGQTDPMTLKESNFSFWYKTQATKQKKTNLRSRIFRQPIQVNQSQLHSL